MQNASYPRYTVKDILARKEQDACLVVGYHYEVSVAVVDGISAVIDPVAGAGVTSALYHVCINNLFDRGDVRGGLDCCIIGGAVIRYCVLNIAVMNMNQYE